MAGFRVHSSVGLAIWLLFMAFMWTLGFTMERLAVISVSSFFIALIGCLLPDVDTPASNVGRALEGSVVLGSLAFGFTTFFRGWETIQQDAVNAVILAAALVVIFVLARPNHRGATHSFKVSMAYGVAVFTWAFLSMGLNMGLYFGVLALASYVSHLVLDG